MDFKFFWKSVLHTRPNVVKEAVTRAQEFVSFKTIYYLGAHTVFVVVLLEENE